jgi:hypothetical protein
MAKTFPALPGSCPLAAIHGLDMPHQGRKDANIGVAVGVAEDAEQLDAFAPCHLRARESVVGLLDPVGRVAGEAVFPGLVWPWPPARAGRPMRAAKNKVRSFMVISFARLPVAVEGEALDALRTHA